MFIGQMSLHGRIEANHFNGWIDVNDGAGCGQENVCRQCRDEQ
jgi:hypothetical protein